MSDLSVDETKLELLLTKFKLELFKELTSTYATIAQFDRLSDDIDKWRTSTDTRIRKLEDGETTDLAISDTKRRAINLAWGLACAVVGALVLLAVTGGGH